MAADAIRGRYQEYIDYVNDLNKNATFFDGLLGTGNAPRNAPGHTEFYEAIVPLVSELLENGSSEDLLDGAKFMLFASHENEKSCKDASWMMMAAQKHALPLIAYLSPADAKDILTSYDKFYPKRLRFPVQKDVAKALKKRAAAKD